MIPFKDARVINAVGFEPKLPGGLAKQTYQYGKAVERNGSLAPAAPLKESAWFDGVEPAFVGEDMELASYEGRREWVGTSLLLVEHNVPKLNREGKTYPVRKRHAAGQGPDAHDSMNHEKDDHDREFNKDGVFEYARDEDGDIVMKADRPTFVMDGIAEWDQIMIPVNSAVEGAHLSEEGAAAYAIFSGGVAPNPTVRVSHRDAESAPNAESPTTTVERIWAENGSENSAGFRRLALADANVLSDSALKAQLTMGMYEGPTS